LAPLLKTDGGLGIELKDLGENQHDALQLDSDSSDSDDNATGSIE
jgi:hypothetical protein